MKPKIVIKCKTCGKIRRWGLWIRLTEKQETDFCDSVIEGEVIVLWASCEKH